MKDHGSWITSTLFRFHVAASLAGTTAAVATCRGVCAIRLPSPCPESPSSPSLLSASSEGTPQFTKENAAILVLTPACSASDPNVPTLISCPFLPSPRRLCQKGVPIFFFFYTTPCSLICLGTSHQLPTPSPLFLLSNP